MTSPDSTPLKRCPKCGQSKPTTEFHKSKHRKDGLGSYCRLCQHAADRAWREKNPERAKQSDREKSARYRVAHPDTVKETQRANRENRREEMRLYARKHYWENPERAREISTRYRNAHPEKVREMQRRSHTPDKWREARYRRKARKIGAVGTHTAADIRAQLKRQKGRCYWCGEKVTEYHVDHVIPLSRGGSNGPENLVIACPFCNMSKHDKLPHEWRGSGGRML